MTDGQAFRHPEWKRLVDGIGPLLEVGRAFSFDELSELAGLDIRSSRGRSQLMKARKWILCEHRLYLENVRDQGYRVIQPSEHGSAASRQVRRAKNRMVHGLAIATNARIDELATEQRKALADIAARLGRGLQEITEIRKDVRKLVREVEHKRLPSPMIDGEKSTVVN